MKLEPHPVQFYLQAGCGSGTLINWHDRYHMWWMSDEQWEGSQSHILPVESNRMWLPFSHTILVCWYLPSLKRPQIWPFQPEMTRQFHTPQATNILKKKPNKTLRKSLERTTGIPLPKTLLITKLWEKIIRLFTLSMNVFIHTLR